MSRRNSNWACRMNSRKSENNLAYIEAAIEGRERKNRFRFARSVYAKKFCRERAFKCQLYIGEKPFPRFKEMTTFERHSENCLLEDKFVATIVDGKTTHKLTTWRWVNVKERNEASKLYSSGKVKELRLKQEALTA